MRVEVYDFTGKERVGFLDKVADLTKSRGTTVSIEVSPARTTSGYGLFEGYGSGLRHEPAQYVALAIDKRTYRIDRFTFARDPDDARRMIYSKVPEYAEQIEDIARDEIRFTWPVLKIGPDVSEIVFEMEAFEADGRSCDAWAAEEAWWAKRGRMPGSHTFDVTKAAAKLSEGGLGLGPAMSNALKGMTSPAIIDQIARQMNATLAEPIRLVPDDLKGKATGFDWKVMNSMRVVAPPRGVTKITGA